MSSDALKESCKKFIQNDSKLKKEGFNYGI